MILNLSSPSVSNVNHLTAHLNQTNSGPCCPPTSNGPGGGPSPNMQGGPGGPGPPMPPNCGPSPNHCGIPPGPGSFPGGPPQFNGMSGGPGGPPGPPGPPNQGGPSCVPNSPNGPNSCGPPPPPPPGPPMPPTSSHLRCQLSLFSESSQAVRLHCLSVISCFCSACPATWLLSGETSWKCHSRNEIFSLVRVSAIPDPP